MEGTERKPWLHHHVTLEGSPPHSGPQASMLYDYDIPITVCALMDPGRHVWVRRVGSLKKTKEGLAAGQWLRKPAAGAEAMAAGAQKQPGAHAQSAQPLYLHHHHHHRATLHPFLRPSPTLPCTDLGSGLLPFYYPPSFVLNICFIKSK